MWHQSFPGSALHTDRFVSLPKSDTSSRVSRRAESILHALRGDPNTAVGRSVVTDWVAEWLERWTVGLKAGERSQVSEQRRSTPENGLRLHKMDGHRTVTQVKAQSMTK